MVGSLSTVGSSALAGNVSLGRSVADEVRINGRVSSDHLLFDKNGRNGSLRIEFPDP